MHFSKTTGFSSKLQNHLFDTFFLCQDLISSSSGLFTKSSLLRRNPRKISDALRINLSESRLSVTNCFFLPHFTLERGQLARGCGRQ